MKKNPANTNSGFNIINVLSTLLKEVGFAGFCLVFVCSFVLIFATETQKQELIDTWILLKYKDTNQLHPTIIIGVLIVGVIMQYLYYKKMNKIKNDEIHRLGTQNTEMWKKILDKNVLNSSKGNQ